MKGARVTLDFGDHLALVQALRLHATNVGVTQKEVVVQALEAYLAQHAEGELLRGLANQTFAEWDNPDDEVYNAL
jgi:hypothetical protein